MRIALLADPQKNELLINFCIAYSPILVKHNLLSFFNSTQTLNSAANLNIKPLVGNNVVAMGQLASFALYNEIDAVIYLRDTLLSEYDDPNELFKFCDRNNIPFATNLASAEILVLAIDRGDLDWRELL